MFNWINKLLTRSGKPASADIPAQAADNSLATAQRGDSVGWQKRGNAFLTNGELRQAFECYQQALAIHPGNVDACVSLAYVLMEENNFPEAGQYLERALRIDPDNADAHYMLGSLASSRQDVAAAAQHWQAAVELRPDFDRAWQDLLDLGTRLQADGNLDTAADVYRRALRIKSDDIVACNNLGLVLTKQGRQEEAIAMFQMALSIEPNNVSVLVNLANAWQTVGKLDTVVSILEKLIDIAPNAVEAHFNLGNVVKAQGNLQRATEHYRKALSINPDDSEIHNNLGNAYLELNQLDAAIECYRKTLSVNPDYAMGHCNLGLALQAQGRVQDALACYDRALTIEPELALAHWNESLCLLLMGDFKKGWEKYEWRWKNKQLKKPPMEFIQPRWHGHEPLHGKTILLWGEQGIGDTIQFCRYVHMVAARGATVILAAPTALKPMMTRLPGISRIVIEGETLPDSDYHCPLMSLPLVFDTRLETIPADIPYLFSEPAKRHQWMTRLQPHTGLRVGLVWSGGFRPDQPEIWSTNERRNIPLKKLAPLKLPGIDFFSLQIGDYGVKQLKELLQTSWDGPTIIDYTHAIADFSDTAALIDNLDLVISVDTSTAHLAGAMGKPVWILNRFDTCWRWLLERTDSPWYPSARLFRQPNPGDWDSVIADVADALAELARSDKHLRSNHVQLD